MMAQVPLTDAHGSIGRGLEQIGKRLLAQTRTKRDEFLAQRVARLTEEERELLERVIPVLEKLQDDDQ